MSKTLAVMGPGHQLATPRPRK